MGTDQVAPPTPEDVKAGTVLAVGASSVVLAGDQEDPAVVGHVLMVDCDDAAPDRVRSWGAKLDGLTVMLRSSPGSYHILNASVEELDQQLLTALRSPSESAHVQQSAKRGRFVLRVSPKWWVDSEAKPTEVYREAPEVVNASWSSTDRPQSRPHLQALDGLTEDQDLLDLVPEDLQVGQRLIRTDYLTMTDDVKRQGV